MGSAESVPRERQQQRSSRLDLLALQEKYDAFRITEDRETDSMIIERSTGRDDRGKLEDPIAVTRFSDKQEQCHQQRMTNNQ